tara:strand:+ start:118 stop:621 length:504 start_codon:yes stop_codon:yes gene_type:complete
MASSVLRYDQLIDTALKGVVREALRQVQETGLPGAHHIYVTFSTHYPGVDIPEFLQKQFPADMTIVLQHQFWNLEVEEDKFAVSLSFNDNQERLDVPFAAVTAFADPSVNFELQFQLIVQDTKTPCPTESTANSSNKLGRKELSDANADPSVGDDNNVVTLDVFRKD